MFIFFPKGINKLQWASPRSSCAGSVFAAMGIILVNGCVLNHTYNWNPTCPAKGTEGAICRPSRARNKEKVIKFNHLKSCPTINLVRSWDRGGSTSDSTKMPSNHVALTSGAGNRMFPHQFGDRSSHINGI